MSDRSGQQPGAVGGAALAARRRPLAAALEFIHTNNSPKSITTRVSGLFRSSPASSFPFGRIALKPQAAHGFGPCNLGCVVCDLVQRGGGGFLAGGADGTT
jgi:hypothetical protein